MKAHTSLPIDTPFPRRKQRGVYTSAQEQVARQKMLFQAENAVRLFQPFTQAEALQQMSQQTNSCARAGMCELPSTRRWTRSSFPHTSEEPRPLANRRKISARLTESQPYPNKLENLHF